LQWIEEGNSISAAACKFAVSKTAITDWLKRTELCGSDTLASLPKNQIYSDLLKREAVQAYLNGEGSLRILALKYGLRDKKQLRIWIMKYTRGETFKSSRGGSARVMDKGRKTSYEERLECVQYCESHSNNYQETAELYNVSYQRVYLWVRKYDEGGEKALLDHRGKGKEETALSELDRLKLELRKLQKVKRELEVENALLKKLEELERRSK